MSVLAQQIGLLEEMPLMRMTGRVREVSGMTIIATGIRARVGSVCQIVPSSRKPVETQVIGFSDERTILMPLSPPLGVTPNDPVRTGGDAEYVSVGRHMLGRVVDGLGRPIDDRGTFTVEAHQPVMASSPQPLSRTRITEPICLGIRSIDAMHSVGRGQRLGVFAGTGVGKSVLMGMIARYTASDVSVVALIGERGREVGDFLAREIGDEGLKKTVMVVSTADESPALRVRACFVATAIAEYFRDQGADVLLMMDSLTRMAMAQRQIGLSAGEPPATKGYPPSVFALLPQLVERAGRTSAGSITGLYSVLVEGDDITEPVADAVRGTLDGHVWLSRKLANAGHYPAVSTLDSVSRLMTDIVEESHLAAARSVRSVLATWDEIEDLVNIGAYAKGANPDYDVAVRMKPRIDAFLRQEMNAQSSFDASVAALCGLSDEIDKARAELS